jgi:alkylated DNA repair dioxygenase AlkB
MEATPGCEPPVDRRVVLDHGAELLLFRAFLTPEQCRDLLDDSRSYPWQRQPVMGMPTLRSNAWFAEDSNAVYEYSGQRWVPAPLTERLRELGARLEPLLGERMNSVLASYYPHGGAAVGFHADDEPLFGTNPTIASLSIGAARTFQIAKSRVRPVTPELELALGDGDLLVMRETFQHHYRHAVKKAARSVLPRLNLSYRRVVR